VGFCYFWCGFKGRGGIGISSREQGLLSSSWDTLEHGQSSSSLENYY
jgi:hypothetical protein